MMTTGRHLRTLYSPLAAGPHGRSAVRHATLKAPFHLRENETFESLTRATQEIAAECPSFALPTLRIAGLGNFIALVLSQDFMVFGQP